MQHLGALTDRPYTLWATASAVSGCEGIFSAEEGANPSWTATTSRSPSCCETDDGVGSVVGARLPVEGVAAGSRSERIWLPICLPGDTPVS